MDDPQQTTHDPLAPSRGVLISLIGVIPFWIMVGVIVGFAIDFYR